MRRWEPGALVTWSGDVINAATLEGHRRLDSTGEVERVITVVRAVDEAIMWMMHGRMQR